MGRTLLGLILVAVFLGGGALLTPNPSLFFNPVSFAAVILGTILILLNSFSLKEVMNSLFFWTEAGRESLGELSDARIQEILQFCDRSRKEGLLSMEPVRSKLSIPYFRDGVGLLIEGRSDKELNDWKDAREAGDLKLEGSQIAVLSAAAQHAPVVGIVVSFFFLLSSLTHLDDTALISVGLTKSLVSIFYGFALANFVFLPWVDQVGARRDAKLRDFKALGDALHALHEGESPSKIQEKLNYRILRAGRN